LNQNSKSGETSSIAGTLIDDNFRDGTVIGIAVDTSRGIGPQIRYFKDGQDMGVAFGISDKEKQTKMAKMKKPGMSGPEINKGAQNSNDKKLYPIVQISQENWTVQLFEPKIWPLIAEPDDDSNICDQINQEQEPPIKAGPHQVLEQLDEEEDEDESSYYSESEDLNSKREEPSHTNKQEPRQRPPRVPQKTSEPSPSLKKKAAPKTDANPQPMSLQEKIRLEQEKMRL